MNTAKWITSGNRNDKANSLPPELFRKKLIVRNGLQQAKLTVSAMGIYEAAINGKKVGDAWFTPGYTHYESYVQLQAYDVTSPLQIGENTLDITVANGWWMGTLGNRNNRYGNHRGLIAELTLTYEDGCAETIGTDESWLWTKDTPVRFADFYDGETIDLRCADEGKWIFQPAILDTGWVPEVKSQLGTKVIEEMRLTPVSQKGDIYDFGQNHAGVIFLSVDAPAGTVISIRHAEILDSHGTLFTQNLRKAKATLTLICGEDGPNEFLPRFTYMGFRYIEVRANAPIKIKKLESVVLTSDCPQIGEFRCSDEKLTRLQQNIQWSQRSNFIDIPTDCPQRDERMGWTGDIAVFAQTAAFNRDISAFMKKWLWDLELYQAPNGAVPFTVPLNPTYQPKAKPFPVAIWSDAATMVPWAVYRAYGDKEILAQQYDSMKAHTDAELRAAAKFSWGYRKYLWNHNLYQFGDWCAPGESYVQWNRKGNFLATTYMANSVRILQQSAAVLGKTEDAKHYAKILEEIKSAYERYYIKPDGKLRGDFQSNYVCALYFDMVPEEKKPAVAKRLVELVRKKNHLIQTGFAGTPYIAFALADNGYTEDAYKLILNEKCPGWLYTVNAGGTTTWERWDALNPDGSIRADTIPDMVSFNHYAYGAVGDFFYRRTLGLEPLEAGYGKFQVKPNPGPLTWAEGSLITKFGKIAIRWERIDGTFTLNITVPEGTECEIVLPNGEAHMVASGSHEFTVTEV